MRDTARERILTDRRRLSVHRTANADDNEQGERS